MVDISKPKRTADSLELEGLLEDGTGLASDSPMSFKAEQTAFRQMDGKAMISSKQQPLAAPIDIESSRIATVMTPIPYLQVFFIGIWRMSQSLFFLVIMPFVNQMLVEDLKVADEVHVGKYSGLVETTAAAGMIIGVFIFARLSDMYGRKWITIIGVGLASVFCVLFGFGRTFSQLLLLRFAMGFANSAQSATSKVMISELTDTTNEAQSFVLMGTGWQLGATIAPMLGAILSKPAESLPWLFKDTIFDTFPYALPCVMAAAIPAVTLLFAIPFAEETHPGLRAGNKPKTQYTKIQPVFNADTEDDDAYPKDFGGKPSFSSEMTLVDNNETNQLEYPPSPDRSYSDAQENISKWACGASFILLLRFLVLVGALAVGTAELLLFFSSPAIGGLGLTKQQMSMFLSARPILVTCFSLVVCPKLFGRYSSEALLRVFICVPPISISVYLLLSIVVSHGTPSSTVTTLLLGSSLVLQTVSNPMWLTLNVLFNARAPTRHHLSQLNAWSELVQQAGIGIGAELGSVGFAWTAEYHLLGGKFIWIALIIFTALTAVLAQKTTKSRGWRDLQAQEDDP